MAYSGSARVAATIAGMVASTLSLTGTAKQTSGNMSNYHNLLTNRDMADQHPIAAITGLQAVLDTKFDDMEVTSDGYVYLICNGERVKGPLGPFAGGGGGGSQNNAELKLTNTTGWLYKNTAQGVACVLTGTWSSLEDDISTGAGTLKVTVNGSVQINRSIEQGDFAIPVESFLSAGSNTVRVNITDVYENSRTLTFTINVVALYLESTFDATAQYTGAITYYYTPTGAVEKTMHFILDGKEIATEVVSVTGQQQEFTIPAQKHGSHNFEVYFTAVVGSDTVPSNSLYYDLMCLEDGNATPIITSTFRPVPTEQFVTFTIPHIVYDPTNLQTTVEYRAAGELVSSLTVDRTEQKWSVQGSEVGDLELTITCGDTVKSFTVPIVESSMDVSAVTNNLTLHLTANGRSNNEANPEVWEFGDYAASLSGFNFKSDGWQLDEDGNTVLRVAGDARVYIPLQIFAEDFRSAGKTIELEFATRDVLNYDAILFSCMSGGRGLEVGAQKATLISEQSQIGTQYKEEEHVRLAFVVEKRANRRLLLMYINGIMSGAVQYPDNDDFSQTEPVGLSIGSSDCTTDIYCIRVYDNDLTRYQVLNNWIADTQVGTLKKERYERNNIYDDYGRITIGTLNKNLPYLVIECPVLPQFKGDKKTCSGYYVDPVHPERSFSFKDAQIDVQGTSSQYYKVKNYKIKFKGGFILTDGTTVEVYAMNDNAVPVNTFTYKADVASIEGANNVVLAQLYNELCPTKTPPQEEDPRVRQTIDGHPIVIFWDSGSGPVFVGKYNFNNDKGTEDVFGFKTGDESWEIKQNGTDRVGFHSADFSEGSGWENDFEARYPEDNTDTTNLEKFSAWLTTTDLTQVTGADLAEAVTINGVEYTQDTEEYRLAKFTAELPDWMDVAAAVFYYVFTEIFLCIDQREKNAFPTLYALLLLWIILFYDADSSLGINNKGALAFEYFLEDIDFTESGDPVYNGQNSVLWVNLRKCFYAEITAEYQRLRTTIRADGSGLPLISYEVVDALFEAHQGKWCEAIYNEDMERKCLDALADGDTSYLPMLLGKKEQQRKWWTYNRFRYLDSKYVTGSSMQNRIIIRAKSKANVSLIAYVNMYGHVYYNDEMAEHRMERGKEYEFVWAASGAEDAVIGINDADMLTSLGDLAPLQVETIDLSPAIHVTYIKVGDGADDYENSSLISITFGNNYLAKYIDLRNCKKLAQSIDISGCTGVEEVYLDGTAVTGIVLPDGGMVRILHIPSTVASIKILNQTKLEEFECPDFSQVSSLRIENCGTLIDTAAIVAAMQSTGRVRLIGMDWTLDSTDVMDKLMGMKGLTETDLNADVAVLSGKVHFATQLPVSKLVQYENQFPYLTITADSYLVDVLKVSPDAVLLDSEGDMLTMYDGGHSTEYSAEQIDSFITAVLEALDSLESNDET